MNISIDIRVTYVHHPIHINMNINMNINIDIDINIIIDIDINVIIDVNISIHIGHADEGDDVDTAYADGVFTYHQPNQPPTTLP